ncbi:phage tail tape measure protein, partial [Klebsiella pneumoniae]|uniref:phage tail tape measure protein n=1 Tax=Klebsiella pneumoniae TaxID=573 RepID=UPI003968B7F6
ARTLNWALSNRKTMEENAQLLMGTKAAFQLSNDAAAHIGDVLSATMNKTTADFQGLSHSSRYLAPELANSR